ncbi:hypothetical protein D3C71_156690 [compost metagenome]
MTAVHSQETTPYHDAVAAVRVEQAEHQTRFNESRGAYDRFYDLASRIGDRAARDALPDEAEIVDALEVSTADRGRQIDMVRDALFLSLEAEMRSIARASLTAEGSIIGRLRADLNQLVRYRLEHLDGVDGKFWDVLRQGLGDFKKERGRMIFRILATWCDVYEIAPQTMIDAATTINIMPDSYIAGAQWDMTSAAVTERWQRYPFDLVADLEEVRGWEERDPEAVEALLLHLQHTRDLSR